MNFLLKWLEKSELAEIKKRLSAHDGLHAEHKQCFSRHSSRLSAHDERLSAHDERLAAHDDLHAQQQKRNEDADGITYQKYAFELLAHSP